MCDLVDGEALAYPHFSASPALGLRGVWISSCTLTVIVARLPSHVHWSPKHLSSTLEVRGVQLPWQGHPWKWATDVGVLKLQGEDPVTMATDAPDLQLRSMLQLTF
jgi:hypothetical protein